MSTAHGTAGTSSRAGASNRCSMRAGRRADRNRQITSCRLLLHRRVPTRHSGTTHPLRLRLTTQIPTTGGHRHQTTTRVHLRRWRMSISVIEFQIPTTSGALGFFSICSYFSLLHNVLLFFFITFQQIDRAPQDISDGVFRTTEFYQSLHWVYLHFESFSFRPLDPLFTRPSQPASNFLNMPFACL